MKPKAGLHKQVSSIFDGVKIPGADSQENESAAPEPVMGMESGMVENDNKSMDDINLSGIPSDPTSSQPVADNTAGNNNLSPGNPENQPVADFEVQRIVKPSMASKVAGKFKNYLNDEDPEKARQKKMSVLVGILFIVFISMMAFVLKSPDSANAKNSIEDVIQMNESREINWSKPELLSEDMRDPMDTRPRETLIEEVEKPKQDYSKFVVTGIVQGDRGNSAIVSNKVLFEGEEIYGATVVKINSDSVEFEMNGQQWIQPLKKNN